MTTTTIEAPSENAPAAVLPPLKEDYNTYFHSSLGTHLGDESTWTCGIRIVLSIPKIHPETKEDIDHLRCGEFAELLACNIRSMFESCGAQPTKLVCIFDWVPDGWLMTLVFDTPTSTNLEEIRQLCELPGMPDAVVKNAFITFVDGYAEAQMMLRRISASEAVCD